MAVAFRRFIAKSLQQFFLVKLHSVINNNIKITLHYRYFLNYILFLENFKIYVVA